MDLSWSVIVVLVAVLLGVLVLNLKLMFYYEHPDESGYLQGFVAKVTALLGMELIWLMGSLIPTDGILIHGAYYLNIKVLWESTLVFILATLLFPVPFALAFYSADTDSRIDSRPAWLQALRRSSIVCLVLCAVHVAMYFTLRNIEIRKCEVGVDGKNTCVIEEDRVPFFLFSAILVGFIGWFLVVMYLGVGLVTLPHGLIIGFIYRPRPISQEEYM